MFALKISLGKKNYPENYVCIYFNVCVSLFKWHRNPNMGSPDWSDSANELIVRADVEDLSITQNLQVPSDSIIERDECVTLACKVASLGISFLIADINNTSAYPLGGLKDIMHMKCLSQFLVQSKC